MNGDKLDQFIEEMLTQKQLPGMNSDVRSQLIIDLRQRLIDQINRALIDAIPEDRIDAFENLLDTPDLPDNALEDALRDSGVDINRITSQTMLRFYDLYIQQSAKEKGL